MIAIHDYLSAIYLEKTNLYFNIFYGVDVFSQFHTDFCVIKCYYSIIRRQLQSNIYKYL